MTDSQQGILTQQLDYLQHQAQCLGLSRCSYQLGLPSAVTDNHQIVVLLSKEFIISYCGGLNSGPQRCCHLNTCAYLTLSGKRDFADTMKLRIWRWGGYPGLA